MGYGIDLPAKNDLLGLPANEAVEIVEKLVPHLVPGQEGAAGVSALLAERVKLHRLLAAQLLPKENFPRGLRGKLQRRRVRIVIRRCRRREEAID